MKMNENFSEYHKLVYSIAKKYANGIFSQEDLVQEGLIGLLDAEKKFSPDKYNVSFSSYAFYWIKKRISEYVKKQKKHFFTSLEEINLEKFYYNENYELTENNSKVGKYEFLSPLETKVLELSYNENIPLTKIAQHLNISREKARQVLNKALRKIKINQKLTNSLN